MGNYLANSSSTWEMTLALISQLLLIFSIYLGSLYYISSIKEHGIKRDNSYRALVLNIYRIP